MVGLDAEFDWCRWWYPHGSNPPVADAGLLYRPTDEDLGVFVGRDLTTLERQSDAPCLVLLGDGGLGKTHELVREARRLETHGSRYMMRNLGNYDSAAEIRRDIFEGQTLQDWADGDGPLVLLLDGFDESQLGIRQLDALLTRELRQLDHSRLVLRVASRPAAWSPHLTEQFRVWWPSTQELVLAVLSRADVLHAAEQVGIENPDAFLSMVLDRRIGSHAARPRTLRALLRIYLNEGELPEARVDIFERSVQLLLTEERYERATQLETSVLDRVRAASNLAAATQLVGNTRIRRRSIPEPTDDELGLDDVIQAGSTLVALEETLNSPLFAHAGEGSVTWTDRDFVEFLAARRLVDLPVSAAVNLLTSGTESGRVPAQLAGTATLLAVLNESFGRWLAPRQPDILLSPDLPTAPEEIRRSVTDAVVQRLRDGLPRLDFVDYRGLCGKDVIDELRELIVDEDAPVGVRRDGMLIAYATDLRSLQGLIVELLEVYAQAASGWQARLAETAALAASSSDDDELRERVVRVMADADTNTSLRAFLADLVHPEWLSVTELLSHLGSDLISTSAASFHLTRTLRDAVREDSDAALAFLRWTSGHESAFDSPWSELASVAIDRLAAEFPDTTAMDAVADFLVEQHAHTYQLLNQRSGLLADLNRALRTQLIDAIAERAPDDFVSLAWELRRIDLLRSDDLEHWLDLLADRRALDDNSAAARLELLVEAIGPPTREAVATAETVAQRRPAIRDFVEVRFGEEAQQRYAELEKQRTKNDAKQRARSIAETFSRERLHESVEAANWPHILAELERSRGRAQPQDFPLIDDRSPANAPAWEELEHSTQQRVVATAIRLLTSGLQDRTLHEGALGLAAFALIRDADPSRVDEMDLETLARWLTPAFGTAGWHDTSAWLVTLVADQDTSQVDAALLPVLEAEARAGFPTVLHRIGDFTSDRLVECLLELVADWQVPPKAVSPLLDAAFDRAPEKARTTALDLIGTSPATRPPPTDSDATQSWYKGVEALIALARSDEIAETWPQVLEVLDDNRAFLEDLARALAFGPASERQFLDAATADQIADLYLLVHEWPRPHYRTGSYTPDPVEEFPETILRRLTGSPTPEAASALERLAEAFEDPVLRALADDRWADVDRESWQPAQLSDLFEILRHHDRRTVSSEAELAALICETLDDVNEELAADRALRLLFWEQQRVSDSHGTRWNGFVPPQETVLSDRLALELRRRLRHRLVVSREVEIAPRAGAEGASRTDLLVSVTRDDAPAISCIVEVKGSWNPDVETAIETQVSDDYLTTSTSNTGVYVVGYFDSEDWSDGDAAGRRERATRFALEDLEEDLTTAARRLNRPGHSLHARVLNLTLERDHDGMQETS